jgi:hypothetical protein
VLSAVVQIRGDLSDIAFETQKFTTKSVMISCFCANILTDLLILYVSYSIQEDSYIYLTERVGYEHLRKSTNNGLMHNSTTEECLNAAFTSCNLWNITLKLAATRSITLVVAVLKMENFDFETAITEDKWHFTVVAIISQCKFNIPIYMNAEAVWEVQG